MMLNQERSGQRKPPVDQVQSSSGGGGGGGGGGGYGAPKGDKGGQLTSRGLGCFIVLADGERWRMMANDGDDDG